VTYVYFVFTVYFARNSLIAFCDIHLNFGAVGRHHDVYQELI